MVTLEQVQKRLSRMEVLLRLRTPAVDSAVRACRQELQQYFRRQLAIAIDGLARLGKQLSPDSSATLLNWQIERDLLRDVLYPHLVHAAVFGHKNALRLGMDLSPTATTTEAADAEEEEYLVYVRAAEYIRSKALTVAADISDTTLKLLRDEIVTGLENREAIRDIAKRLEGILDDVDRAKLIAETEVMDALNYAAVEAYKEMGAKKHEWITTPDERLCEICAPNDGVVVPIGEAFPSGDERPPVHPRCRCSTGPVME